MAIYAIGDLHLSFGTNKPMDIFKGWDNHIKKLTKNWESTVGTDDTVVLCGDFSWAMSLPETKLDFEFLCSLPGNKILLKGNHDYWWTTVTKMNEFLRAGGYENIGFLHNNSYIVDNALVCGTRGWLPDSKSGEDKKISVREARRLKASFDYIKGDYPKYVFLHYPPVTKDLTANPIFETLMLEDVKLCCYGHLHSGSFHTAVQGNCYGINYKLVSNDFVDFTPQRII